MNPKKIILMAVAIAMGCLGLWWFLRARAASPEKTAEAPIQGLADASKTMAPPTLAPPVAPPASKTAAAPIAAKPPGAAPAPDPNTDPHADLKTAVMDIGRLYRAGDLAEFYQTYTPPDKIDPQNLLDLQVQTNNENSQERAMAQEMYEQEAKYFESLEDQTPTYNDAGDEATYGPDGNYNTMVFIKINSKWYIKGNAGN